MSEKTIVYPLSMGVNSQTIGNLTDLTTTNKTNVVASINEVNSKFPVSIANGGTGATSASAARTNLEVQKEYSLYSNTSGTQSTVVLSDDISNYDKICVFFKDDGNTGDSQEFIPANITGVNLETIIASGDDSKLYIKSSQINFSGTSITWANNYGIYVFSNGQTAWGAIGTNYIYITKVVGYKY